MAGQLYSVNTLGGNWSVPYLTDQLRHVSQPQFRFRQFIDVHEAVGYGRGDTFNFDKAGNVATQGGTLLETQTIPETNFVTNQGTAVITEYGNAVPFTAKLDALGQFEVPATIQQKLRDDWVKVLESAAGSQFTATEDYAVCTATNGVVFTTNGTATATANADLTASNVRDIVDRMKINFVPAYSGNEYVCIASVNALSGMHADTGAGGWNDISKYTDSRVSNLFSGEVGSFYQTRFVEETGFLSNVIGSSSVNGAAVFFGSDSVIEAMTIPEEIRMKNPTDFGRDQGLAWYALLGFQKVWDRAVDGEQHIIYVTSA